MDLPLVMGQLSPYALPHCLRNMKRMILQNRTYPRQAGYEEGILVLDLIARWIVPLKCPDSTWLGLEAFQLLPGHKGLDLPEAFVQSRPFSLEVRFHRANRRSPEYISFPVPIPHARSGVHVIVVVQVLPIDGVRIIVIVSLLGLVQMVEDPVDDPADGTGVLADLLQGANRLVLFGGVFFRCHFKMTTGEEYLSFAVVRNSGCKHLYWVDGNGKREGHDIGPPRIHQLFLRARVHNSQLQSQQVYRDIRLSREYLGYFVNSRTVRPASMGVALVESFKGGGDASRGGR